MLSHPDVCEPCLEHAVKVRRKLYSNSHKGWIVYLVVVRVYSVARTYLRRISVLERTGESKESDSKDYAT